MPCPPVSVRVPRRGLALLVLTAAAALSPAARSTPCAPSDAGNCLTKARELLAAGDASGALGRAEEGLEYAPEHLDLLDVAAEAAVAAEEKDRALGYLVIALATAEGKAEEAARVADWQKRAGELDPLAGKDRTLVAGYANDLLLLGQDCSSRKLWLNAVELLSRCGGTSAKSAADAALEKVYGNKKAVEALLDSGFDVPLAVKKKRNPAAIAKEDAKHADWANAWQIKGDSYTIISNCGRELSEQMSRAMEQMNAHYRKVFHVKEHGGGNTARVTIKVYAKRSEFDADERKPDPNVQGFFVPNVNIVVTFDPRSKDWPLSELWSTLFHEASHQFTHLISADLIPGWLNEGTASYFEGARLLPNGAVETNLVPEGRLIELKGVFDEKKPTLKEVVSYFEPGSYDGSYYPVGWGLVYFFQNYENEKSERIYVPVYQDYMASYKSGGKHDVVGRFVEYFVTKARDPAVKSFEDFEKRWQQWMLELHDVWFGPPEKADLLVARARKQAANKKYEAAIESYRWALRKRPGDALAALELSDALAGTKQADAALHAVHEALEAGRALPDPKAIVAGSKDMTVEGLLSACAERARKINKEVAEKRRDVDARFLAATTEAARSYVEAGLPLAAVRLLDTARGTFGDAAVLAAQRGAILTKSGVDPRRWRRLPLDAELTAWNASPPWKLEDGVLHVEAPGPAFAFYEGDLPERFRFEALVDTAGIEPGKGLFGLFYGVNGSGARYFAGLQPGLFMAGVLTKEGWKDDLEIPPVQLQNASVRIALELVPGKLEYYVDDVKVSEKAFSREETAGAIGLLFQGGKAEFSEVRIKH